MKKVLFILALAIGFVSCGTEGATEGGTATDTTVVAADTTSVSVTEAVSVSDVTVTESDSTATE